ncbi:AtpZ/AtpI family protein [Candidatus Gottesmanbacteria bacterium]|nr:AtpZ/AtpI family protein [Candidatus Gottesmanbacteria bacterium]
MGIQRVKRSNEDGREEFELRVTGEKTNIAPRGTVKRKEFLSSAPWEYLGLIGEIGFAISVPIAGGALIGVVIDRTWSTSPKATLSLLFLGVIVSFVNLFKTVNTIVQNRK